MTRQELYQWFMDVLWCAYVGYDELFGLSYTYELYVGGELEGDHSFVFLWR